VLACGWARKNQVLLIANQLGHDEASLAENRNSQILKLCDLTQFYSPLSGGVKRYLQEKIRYIQTRSPEDEHVLVVPGEKTERVTGERSQVYTIRSPLVPRSGGYRALINLSAVAEIIGSERPDIIECGDPYQLGWKAISIGRASQIPVVGFYHSHFSEAYLHGAIGFLRPLAQRYARKLYNHFEATLVPSEPLAHVLENWGVCNVRAVKLGVNTEVLSPYPDDRAETRQSLGIPFDRVFLLYVGRLAPEKNVDTLFKAFRILAARRPNEFELLVIGSGPEQEKLSQLKAEISGLKSIGYCNDPAELARIYRAADLFVHPGIMETFGLVALESQACGTPVVGIRGTRMDKIILHDQESWALKNNPEALARAIEGFSLKDLRTIGSVAAKAVAEHYSWPRVFDGLFCIYRDVCTKYRKS